MPYIDRVGWTNQPTMEGEEGPYLFAPYIEKRGGSPTNYGGDRRVADDAEEADDTIGPPPITHI